VQVSPSVTTAITTDSKKELLRSYLADFSAGEKGDLSAGSARVLAAFPGSFGDPAAVILLARVGQQAAGLGVCDLTAGGSRRPLNSNTCTSGLPCAAAASGES
jgi:hypothetical protein